MDKPTCSEEDCESPAKVRGMCQRDYFRWWTKQPPSVDRKQCIEDDCERIATRRGLCEKDYRRVMRVERGDQIRATRRIYLEKNREHVNAVFKDWEARNPQKVSLRDRRNKANRRAAKQGETLDYELIIAEHGMVCHICARPIEWADLHMDHVIPFGGGHNGTHTYDNVRPSHNRCNLRKGTKLMSEIGGRLDAPDPGPAV